MKYLQTYESSKRRTADESKWTADKRFFYLNDEKIYSFKTYVIVNDSKFLVSQPGKSIPPSYTLYRKIKIPESAESVDKVFWKDFWVKQLAKFDSRYDSQIRICDSNDDVVHGSTYHFNFVNHAIIYQTDDYDEAIAKMEELAAPSKFGL
jgi:hypothetical protein